MTFHPLMCARTHDPSQLGDRTSELDLVYQTRPAYMYLLPFREVRARESMRINENQ